MAIASAIGAAIGVGGSLLAGSKNSKAIKKSTAAQIEANRQSLELQKDIYNQNKGALAPFMQRGNAAGDAISYLLGLPAYTSQQATSPPPTSALAQYSQDGLSGALSQIINNQSVGWNGQNNPPYALSLSGVPANPANSAQNAYEVFKQSTGYQSRFNEGMRAINANLAGRGVLQSGAAIKSALRYGQDYASNEFGNYLGYLGNQQGVGLQGAGALAGVGVDYARDAGRINSDTADAISAGAIAKANNSNQVLGGILGSVGGLFGGSSYGANR